MKRLCSKTSNLHSPRIKARSTVPLLSPWAKESRDQKWTHLEEENKKKQTLNKQTSFIGKVRLSLQPPAESFCMRQLVANATQSFKPSSSWTLPPPKIKLCASRCRNVICEGVNVKSRNSQNLKSYAFPRFSSLNCAAYHIFFLLHLKNTECLCRKINSLDTVCLIIKLHYQNLHQRVTVNWKLLLFDIF